MEQLSRRRFLQNGLAVSGALGLQPFLAGSALAQSAKFTRYSIQSAEGKKMLEIFARGVRIMMDTAESDPRSWTFQWYTHMVKGVKDRGQENLLKAHSDVEKAFEIKRIYPDKNDPKRAIAEKMWSTCQNHLYGESIDFFPPWHRMYLRFLEQIIRAVTKEPGFAMPYWDYTDTQYRSLPEEFRQKDHTVWGSLYRENRYKGINDGQPVDDVADATLFPINTNSLLSAEYSDYGIADAGFCTNLNLDPHAAIHEDVGNDNGMSSVRWAASDPVFWAHHSNIDRIWASWNAAGGINQSSEPDFANKTYTFVDGNGAEVTARVGDYLDTNLGDDAYQYDVLLPRPEGGPTLGKKRTYVLHAVARQTVGNISLRSGTRRLAFRVERTALAGVAQPHLFSQRLKALPGEGVLYLRLDGVAARRDPQVPIDVYLTIPGSETKKLNRKDPGYVGTLSFFDAGHQHGHGGPMMGRNYSFVVSPATRKLLADAKVNVPQITLQTAKALPIGTGAVIAKISLVSS